MRPVVALCTASLFFIAPAAGAPDAHPLDKDKTGIEWVQPFDKALAKAKAEKRLLAIKPVAFGTSRDGGW